MSIRDDALRLDNQLCFALYAASREVIRQYRPLLEPLGLTYTQYIVLLVLWEEDDVPVNRLGERLLLDSGTLTPLLKKLEAQGLVTRRRDAGDERSVRVSLTVDGRALQERAGHVPGAMACALGLQLDEIVRLRDSLSVLTGLLRGGQGVDGTDVPIGKQG